jgi:cell division protein FtsW
MSAQRPYVPFPGARKPAALRANLDWRAELSIWWREVDRVLLGLIGALMLMGTVAVLAASPAGAHRLSGAAGILPPLYFFWHHVIWQFLGMSVLVGASMLERDVARRGAILLACAMFGAMMLVPFVSDTINGARRWIDLGIRFQPSEFLKPAFAVTLAWVLSWRWRVPELPLVPITGAYLAAIVALLMLQPDLGSAILFVGCWFVLVFILGMNLQRVMILAGSGIAALGLAYALYDNARHRIDAFMGGGTAYDQVDLAARTLMAGGWKGTGLWLGVRKMNLPEAHTDYILSVIGEEFGLVTCAIIVLLYLAIAARVIVRLLEETDLFALLAGAGLCALFVGQAMINILVNLQLFPSKGMTLPLISYGGSSTIAVCLTLGLLLAFTRRNPYLSREGFDWVRPDGEEKAK